VTARDREADLIGHVLGHATCTPECDDFRRLLGEVDGAARVRERVEAVADWCAAKEADMRASIGIDGYSEGARDAYDVTESRIRAALTDEAAP
jgi:dienelactone hydrolase